MDHQLYTVYDVPLMYKHVLEKMVKKLQSILEEKRLPSKFADDFRTEVIKQLVEKKHLSHLSMNKMQESGLLNGLNIDFVPDKPKARDHKNQRSDQNHYQTIQKRMASDFSSNQLCKPTSPHKRLRTLDMGGDGQLDNHSYSDNEKNNDDIHCDGVSIDNKKDKQQVNPITDQEKEYHRQLKSSKINSETAANTRGAIECSRRNSNVIRQQRNVLHRMPMVYPNGRQPRPNLQYPQYPQRYPYQNQYQQQRHPYHQQMMYHQWRMVQAHYHYYNQQYYNRNQQMMGPRLLQSNENQQPTFHTLKSRKEQEEENELQQNDKERTECKVEIEEETILESETEAGNPPEIEAGDRVEIETVNEYQEQKDVKVEPEVKEEVMETIEDLWMGPRVIELPRPQPLAFIEQRCHMPAIQMTYTREINQTDGAEEEKVELMSDDSDESYSEEEEEKEDVILDESVLIRLDNNFEELSSDSEEINDGIDHELIENCKNLVLCQYEKIQRVKSKFKLNLLNGMMLIKGRDMIFKKCNGEASLSSSTAGQ